MLLFFHLIHAAGAARASIVAYISPAVVASLGVLVLHEHFGIGMAVGLALVLLGSALGSSGTRSSDSTGRQLHVGLD
jgi:drug/metabolite transporter (DMT)-like permease